MAGESNNDKGNEQGFNSSLFVQAVQIAAKTKDFIHVQIFDAIVQDGTQDKTKFTCFVDSVDSSLNNLEVRYHLCIDDGEINTPADGSTVTIAKTAFTDPYIVKATELKSKLIAIGNQTYLNDGTIQDFEFYQDAGSVEGSFGGFIKSLDPQDTTKGLLARINKLENLLNDLQTKFQTWIVAPNDGGLALKTILTVTPPIWNIPHIIPSQRNDIENPHITHGLKNKTL